MNNALHSCLSPRQPPSLLAGYFEAYREQLLRYLGSKLASPEQAEDLLQQTFLRLLERNDAGDIQNPKAYLLTIARHVLADYYRRQMARLDKASVCFEDSEFPDERESPQQHNVTDEYLDHLAEAIEGLSPSVQRAFVLSRVFGYTHKEVAGYLGLSSRTVEKHVAKGLALCFTHMRAAGHLDAG